MDAKYKIYKGWPEAPRLTDILGLSRGVTAIVGCGGKTSLLYRLAEENRASKTLIGTTTRIYRPERHIYDHEAVLGVDEPGQNGVTLISGGERDGKLLPPPEDGLERARTNFDYTFLECDGSKGLPLKGWAEYEPQIPAYAGTTVGVAVIWSIGQEVSPKNAHRPELFCEMTGARPGGVIGTEHIAAMIASPMGLFKNSSGKRVLFFNQIESSVARDQAREIMRLLPEDFSRGLSRVVAGSLERNEYETLWEA